MGDREECKGVCEAPSSELAHRGCEPQVQPPERVGLDPPEDLPVPLVAGGAAPDPGSSGPGKGGRGTLVTEPVPAVVLILQ